MQTITTRQRDDLTEIIRFLCPNGRKIMAIKFLRGLNPSLGLKEAKDAVESAEYGNALLLWQALPPIDDLPHTSAPGKTDRDLCEALVREAPICGRSFMAGWDAHAR